MPEQNDPTLPANISMRDLAQIAGVSAMTVSRALRNSPKISEKTRQRIRQLAQEHNYSINPLVAAQMASIHGRRSVTYKATLGLITRTPTEGVWGGAAKVIEGVRKRCKEMGFTCDTFDLADPELTPSRLNRMLETRGIHGLIEAPMVADLADYELDSDRLILVSSNPGTLPQTIHRVCPDHYGNMDMLLRRIQQAGFKRPGFLVTLELDRRLNHLWTSRYLAFQQTEGFAKIAPYMPNNITEFDRSSFTKWLEANQPDILIVSNHELFRDKFFDQVGIEIPNDIEVLKININGPEYGFSGIDQRSEQVGAGCVKLLSQLMYQNEYGPPENPVSVVVPGKWIQGHTSPTLQQAAQ
ncbi:MAG: LacI family DNA-binding transcriptional regulator [Verrucomicrobiota bacterium]